MMLLEKPTVTHRESVVPGMLYMNENDLCEALSHDEGYEKYVGFAYGLNGINAIVLIKEIGDNKYNVVTVTNMDVKFVTVDGIAKSYQYMSKSLMDNSYNGSLDIKLLC